MKIAGVYILVPTPPPLLKRWQFNSKISTDNTPAIIITGGAAKVAGVLTSKISLTYIRFV
jgi:hypothetical protein